MAFGSALVDKGWILRREDTEPEETWVEGERQLEPKDPEDDKATNRFRCRFQLVKGSESQQDGRRRRVVRPVLLWGRNTKIQKGDRVKIRSREHFGVEEPVFQVDGDPEPLRKRRRVIGYEATLVKAE